MKTDELIDLNYQKSGLVIVTKKDLEALEQAAKLVLDEFADWYDGPGYFPSSFVAAIIRLRRALENGK